MTPQNQTGPSRVLLIAASLVLVIAGLRAAAPFLVPLVLATFLTIITLPVLHWLRRMRVPTPFAVFLVVLMTFGSLGLIGLVGYASLTEIAQSLPQYVQKLQAMEHGALAWLEARGVPVSGDVYAVLLGEPTRLLNLATGLVRGAANFVSSTVIVALYVIFMLLEAASIPERVRYGLGHEVDLSRFATAVHDIQRYLAIKTAISLVTGGLIALWLWVIGVDFPLLWGAIAFALNYIPNVGSLLAALPGVGFAMLQLGLGSGALAATGYLAVNVTLGNLVEPQVMGRGFGISTLVIVVSLVFWGWLWGPIGMLLSVPLTVIVRIALEHNPDLRWLARVLGGSPAPAVGGVGSLESEPGSPEPAGSAPAAPAPASTAAGRTG